MRRAQSWGSVAIPQVSRWASAVRLSSRRSLTSITHVSASSLFDPGRSDFESGSAVALGRPAASATITRAAKPKHSRKQGSHNLFRVVRDYRKMGIIRIEPGLAIGNRFSHGTTHRDRNIYV